MTVVNLNGVWKSIDYDDKIKLIKNSYKVLMVEHYPFLRYNRGLHNCYSQLRNCERLMKIFEQFENQVNKINENDVNYVVNELCVNNNLKTILRIIEDQYENVDNISTDARYNNNKIKNINTMNVTSNAIPFKQRLQYHIRNANIVEEHIDTDIEKYRHYTQDNTAYTVTYFFIIDWILYWIRCIANWANITLEVAYEKIGEYKGTYVESLGMAGKSMLSDINHAVRLKNQIRTKLTELENENTIFERKVAIILEIYRAYHRINSLLQLELVRERYRNAH